MNGSALDLHNDSEINWNGTQFGADSFQYCHIFICQFNFTLPAINLSLENYDILVAQFLFLSASC